MQTVYKYPVPIEDRFTLDMPSGAQVLYVAPQNGEPMMWALVDPDAPTEQRTFHVRGTGHTIEDDLGYLGSFIVAAGQFVGHLFQTHRK